MQMVQWICKAFDKLLFDQTGLFTLKQENEEAGIASFCSFSLPGNLDVLIFQAVVIWFQLLTNEQMS